MWVTLAQIASLIYWTNPEMRPLTINSVYSSVLAAPNYTFITAGYEVLGVV